MDDTCAGRYRRSTVGDREARSNMQFAASLWYLLHLPTIVTEEVKPLPTLFPLGVSSELLLRAIFRVAWLATREYEGGISSAMRYKVRNILVNTIVALTHCNQ